MIRTKAKSLILSIMLVMACFVFFACKEEAKINVENISFTEQSISLLVGEEYTPEVKVLPSYATTRSYTLISSDTTALQIEGGTIKAIKASMGVKLKVVSDDSQSVNDVISVNIYNEASELNVPTELKFDGEKFTFLGKDNSNAYMLKFNGQEINIGNNTEYSFSDVVSKIEDIYDKVITCEVKAVGDGKIFKDSQYSEPIKFVKLSNVKNAYIENDTLYFNAIDNVASYNVDVIASGKVKETLLVNNSSQNELVSLSLVEFADSVNGAEYTLQITPNIDGYISQQSVDVYGGTSISVKYVVLGTVQNLAINDRVISWGFVKNAKSYTVQIHKNGQLLDTYANITQNYLQIEYVESGEYECKVIASSTSANTTTGKIYSQVAKFNILQAPEITIDENTINWTSVVDAEGYLVSIKTSTGSVLLNKSFVLYPTYDVSGFGAGTYYIEVVACGNTTNDEGVAILSSQASGFVDWTILQDLTLKVEDKKLLIQDGDASSLNTYHITFDDVDVVVTTQDLEYDDATSTFSYDLSNHNFEAGTYTITVQSLGDGNIFDASVNNTSVVKLPNGTISGLSNLQFTVASIANASSYKIEVYKAQDTQNAIITLDNMLNGNKFGLDASNLEAGSYVARVFVYGNGKNVFDADNTSEGTTINFEKLDIPTITIDSENLKLQINATKCNLFENSNNKHINGNEYSLSNLNAGDYVYTAQALGDNATVLDSDITLLDNAIKVKKLTTPTISFDKNTLAYTVNCADEASLGQLQYVFTLNNQEVTVANNQASCASLIVDAGKFDASVYVKAQVVAGYNLVIDSGVKTHSVTKLAGLTDFQISNGNLIVTPNEALTGTGYSLSLRIDNGENDIVLDNFSYANARFETDLYDNKYNIIDKLQDILTSSGEYTIFTTISQNNDNVVTSSEAQCVNTLKVLGRVSTINKNAQTIEFNAVENATNYMAVLKLDNVEHYIDLASNFTADTKNVLNIENLISLMSTKGVNYVEKTPYTIGFVALNIDTRTIPNKGVNTYSFEFLKTPTISIIEQENSSVKYLAIANNDEDVTNYNVVISQTTDIKNEAVTKQTGDNTLINMDELQIEAGNVKIDVHSLVSGGDFFESKHTVLNITKLASSAISIVNGVLQWNQVTGAKQYNLVYSNSISNGTIVLTEGVENFTINGGVCSYNFDALEAGSSRMYLQVDSQVKVGGTYYLNSDNGEMFENVYKLTTPTIKVASGQINVELRKVEIEKFKNIEVKVNDQVVSINITEQQTGVTIVENGDKLSIVIAPDLLLQYGTTELLKETVTLKAYSNNNTTLNSSVASKDIYGLLSPTGLDITTSTTTQTTAEGKNIIEEIFEKITWNNPQANGTYVSKYELIINYTGKDYIYESTSRIFMMPTYYDEDGDGVKDDAEVEFGAGVYTIKLRALTDDNTQYVNSKYCNSITVTILATPTGLETKDGNIIWQNDDGVGYYLVKVYLIEGSKQTLIDSSNASVNEFDLTTLKPFATGVYGVSIQAMHDSSKVLASKESEILQVVRLPQVEKYYVKNGELFIKMHAFFSRAEVCLTGEQGIYTFDIVNTASNDNVLNYVKNGLFMTWAKSDIISTYTNDNYYTDVKYEVEGDSTLRMALAGDYSISIKLYGNTVTSEVINMLPAGASIGGIISGHASHPVNMYYDYNSSVIEKNVVEKLTTPTLSVSETERGVVLMNSPRGLSYSLQYYIDEDTSLQGVHLYEVNIATSAEYKIYVAEIVNQTKLTESLTAVGGSLITDSADRFNLQHFEYNGITFNVINANAEGKIPFDFNNPYYYYYNATGEYTYIDLTAGGSFVFSVRLLGDDSIFAQSSISDIVTIKRYNVLGLSVNNGVLSWLNQATKYDHPVYIITLINENETYNIVLYNPKVHTSEQDLLACLDSSKTYIFDTINYSTEDGVEDEVITYEGLADIVDKARAQGLANMVGLGGTFMATVKAHYTDTTSMDIVLAQDGESKTLAILPQAQISLVDGNLSWNMSSVTNTSGKEYITKYLLEVFNGETKLYEIILNTGDYSVYNYVATYQLPEVLNNTNDGEFKFNTNSNYTFNLTALGGDAKTYVNSVSTTTGEVSILPNLENVRMSNGVLTWDNSTSNSVEVYVSYVMGGSTITFVVLETDNTFELPASYTDTSETVRQLVAGYDYHIKVRLRGYANTLNGFFSKEIVAQRLPTIDVATIATNRGKLTWIAVQLEGIQYSVEYTLDDGTIGQTELLSTNSYDFSGFASGVINVKVITHHNVHFTAFESSSLDVFKLDIPANIKYHEGTTTISWDKVVDANGNPVNDYMVSVQEEGKELAEYACTSNEWVITGVASNVFSVAVKAISTDTNGKVINSDYSAYQSMELPKQVDASTFVFDKELNAFKWKAIDGEQGGDKYYIGYNYYDTILTTETSAEVTQVAYLPVTESSIINGEKYYFYYPHKIGSYRVIYVQVIRAESLSSQPTRCPNASGDGYYELDFDLFSAGDGSEGNPYLISNQTHLRNVKYFLNANYELDSNITLTSNSPITDSNQVFTGTINGNGKYISGANSLTTLEKLSSSGYVGLFNKVSGATFANITLTNFKVGGYVNSSSVYMGILVGYADNESKFTNITINSSVISLTKSTTIGYTGNNVDMYVGVIAGYANGCTFTNCTISLGGTEANIIADVEGDSQTLLAIGGIAGFANNSTLTNNTSNDSNAFIVSTILTVVGGSPAIYVGALVGESGGENMSISGNSCTYSESLGGNLTQKTNEIGN